MFKVKHCVHAEWKYYAVTYAGTGRRHTSVPSKTDLPVARAPRRAHVLTKILIHTHTRGTTCPPSSAISLSPSLFPFSVTIPTSRARRDGRWGHHLNSTWSEHQPRLGSPMARTPAVGPHSPADNEKLPSMGRTPEVGARSTPTACMTNDRPLFNAGRMLPSAPSPDLLSAHLD